MDHLEFFKKLRDTSGEIVTAMESEDDVQLEQAMGKFILLMLKADALKG
ncbi:hypothetical protein ABEV55_12275 [Aneurinibacillus thermoaerophilus]|nr:hypothetical protein [Aneurinibacillus thermoaerophilus]